MFGTSQCDLGTVPQEMAHKGTIVPDARPMQVNARLRGMESRQGHACSSAHPAQKGQHGWHTLPGSSSGEGLGSLKHAATASCFSVIWAIGLFNAWSGVQHLGLHSQPGRGDGHEVS